MKRYRGESPSVTRARWATERRRRMVLRWGLVDRLPSAMQRPFYKPMKKRGKRGPLTKDERQEAFYARQNLSKMDAKKWWDR